LGEVGGGRLEAGLTHAAVRGTDGVVGVRQYTRLLAGGRIARAPLYNHAPHF